MNIFILSKDPVQAAQMQCDKHVVKMVLETAQMLCTAVRECGGEAPYKATHKNHPCSLWARKSKSNFEWLQRYGVALCEEYTKRYRKTHKSESIIRAVSSDFIPEGELTPFAQAMPDQYRNSDPVIAYRNYYLGDKSRFAEWNKGTPPPAFWIDKQEVIC